MIKNVLGYKDEIIVTAFGESESGPGWHNRAIRVVMRDRNQNLRMECIQPEDQTGAMRLLHAISNAAHLDGECA